MMMLQRTAQDARTPLPGARGFVALILIGAIGILAGCDRSSSAVNYPPPQLSSIEVGPSISNVPAGLVGHFTATGIYIGGSKRDLSMQVAWSSTNMAVASVVSGGIATTVSPGSTKIMASLGGIAGSANLVVTPANLVVIDITPTNLSVASGLSDSLRASGVYSDNSVHDITAAVTWSSSNSSVVSISNASTSPGQTMAQMSGSSTITATLGNVSGSTMLTVTAATLVSIGVTPANSTIANGLATALKASGLYTDNSTHDLTSVVAWSSGSPAVAAISNMAGLNGVATALGVGSTQITAALGSVSGATTLTVSPATLVSIGVTPVNPGVAKGLMTQFTAMGTYTDNSVQNLTAAALWSSSDTSVASVSNAAGVEGQGMALNQGSVTVTAAMGAIQGSSSLTVTPATLVSIGVTPSNPSVAKGLSTQLIATGVYTDNSTQNLTAAVAWMTSAAAVVSVSNASGTNGLATSGTPGSATVSAASGSISGSTILTVTPATLVSIAVTPANPSIANGLSTQLIATGTYTDNSTQNLTTTVGWSSSASAVASVSNASGSNGLATSVSPGSATITAASGTVSGSTSLTVTPATLVSIAVTPANPSIADGTAQQFTATGTYTDNSTQNLTATVAWNSTDTSVAAVSNAAGSNGLATTLAQGSVTISAALGAVSGSTGLTVTAATLVSLTVIPANPSIANGTNQQLSATGTYTDHSTQDLTSSVTWGSSNSSVASISNASGSNGLATAVAQGSTSVTATLGGVSGSTSLTVTPAALVSIAVIPATPSIANGTNQQFAATGTYTDNSTQPLTTAVMWSSSSTAVAMISNASGTNGLATSAGQGSTTVTATLGSVSGSTILSVTPAALVSITVTPATPSITARTTQRFTATGTYTDNSMQNLTTTVTWSSSSSTIASISNAAGSNGLAAGSGAGTTSIGASWGGIVSQSVTLTVTVASEYAYLTNQNDNTVSEYVIGAGGALTLIGTVAAGNEPNAVAVDPTGRYVYVANWNDGTVSEYAVGAGGSLKGIGTIFSGTNPASLAVDTTGQYVYVANLGSNTVSQYAIGAGGVLTSLGAVPAAGSPISVNVDPTGNYAYVADETGNAVSQYSIGTGGLLTSLGTVATGSDPQYLAVDPTGRYAYAANWNDGTISEYTINSNGTLTAIGTIAAGSCPETVAVDPSGHYAYAENWCSNTVSEYSIGTGGVLTSIGSISTGSGAWFLTIDPSGSDVYVTNFSDSTVSEYSIGAGGVLTAIGTVATGSGPNAITSSY